MGMDLYGVGGYFRFASRAWVGVLYWAQEYGWRASMTGPPKELKCEEWLAVCKKYGYNGYQTNDGQLFYARDAKKLAEALERLLSDMQDKEPPVDHEIALMLSPSRKQHIKGFIEYCRQGSFRIC